MTYTRLVLLYTTTGKLTLISGVSNLYQYTRQTVFGQVSYCEVYSLNYQFPSQKLREGVRGKTLPALATKYGQTSSKRLMLHYIRLFIRLVYITKEIATQMYTQFLPFSHS